MLLTILIITCEANSSVDTGAVIGGTVAGSIALMTLVIPLLGCLIYNKKRRRLGTEKYILDYLTQL